MFRSILTIIGTPLPYLFKILTNTYNVKFQCETFSCVGKWVRCYSRVLKSAPAFRLASLQHQVCLWWDDLLSTTLPPWMCSSHIYHAKDGLQQQQVVLVCLEGALTGCDGLIPTSIRALLAFKVAERQSPMVTQELRKIIGWLCFFYNSITLESLQFQFFFSCFWYFIYLYAKKPAKKI